MEQETAVLDTLRPVPMEVICDSLISQDLNSSTKLPTGTLPANHTFGLIFPLKSDANITMYWGNPSAGLPTYAMTEASGKTTLVFITSNRTSVPQDSSPLNNHLTSLNSPTLVSSGMAGNAYSSTSSSSNGFLSNSVAGLIQGKEGTYNIWAKTPSNPADFKYWFGLEYDSNNSKGIGIRTNDTSPPNVRAVANGTTIIATPNDNVGSGNWQMLSLTVKDGYASLYVDGSLDGTAAWFHPGKNAISGLSLARGITSAGPDATIDEATFSKVARTSNWLTASFNNQKPNSAYLNFGNLLGPISLNDLTGTKVYGKKEVP